MADVDKLHSSRNCIQRCPLPRHPLAPRTHIQLLLYTIQTHWNANDPNARKSKRKISIILGHLCLVCPSSVLPIAITLALHHVLNDGVCILSRRSIRSLSWADQWTRKKNYQSWKWRDETVRHTHSLFHRVPGNGFWHFSLSRLTWTNNSSWNFMWRCARTRKQLRSVNIGCNSNEF